MRRFIHRARVRAARHFDRHYRARYQARAHLVFVIDGVLVLAVLALLGLGSYFAYFYHPLRDDFRIEIATPPSPRAGEETEIAVRVVNEGKHVLRAAVLTVHVPGQFLLRGSPAVEIGVLPPLGAVEYRFKGLLVGPASEEGVYAHFTATDEEGGRDEELASGTLAWRENLIGAAFSFGASDRLFIVGEEIAETIAVVNGSRLTLEDVAVRPRWPQGFRLQRATPPMSKGAFYLGDVEADGGAAAIDFIGRFEAPEPAAAFEADVHATVEGQEVLVARAKSSVETFESGLRVAIRLEWPKRPLAPGDDVRFVIDYANEGMNTFDSLTFTLPLDPALVAAPEGRLDWHLEETLPPGSSGSLQGTLKIRERPERTMTRARLVLQPRVLFIRSGEERLGLREGGVMTAEPLEAKVDGAVSLEAVARYFTVEGDQVGRGPLPPRVGKTTTYWISMAARTTSSPIRDGRLTVTMGPGVAWTGRAVPSIGDIEPYLDSTGRLVWDLPEAEAWGGYVSPLAGLTFEVSLVPTAAQAGTAARLVENAVFEATDAWTGSILKDASGPLTTSVPADAFIRGRTEVQP